MIAADSCISPLGQTQGDSDRYLPAILYGCVPVFTCDGEEGSFDEVIQCVATLSYLTHRPP